MAATKRRARIHQILLRQVMISSTPQALDPLPKKDTYQSSQTFSQLNIDLYDLDNIQTDVCFDGLNNSYTLRHNQIIDHFHHVNCHQYLSPKGAQTIHDLMQQKSLILHHLIKEQLNSSPTKVHLLSVPIDLHQHDTFINCHCMLPLPTLLPNTIIGFIDMTRNNGNPSVKRFDTFKMAYTQHCQRSIKIVPILVT